MDGMNKTYVPHESVFEIDDHADAVLSLFTDSLPSAATFFGGLTSVNTKL